MEAQLRQHTTDLIRIWSERDRYRTELDTSSARFQRQQTLLTPVTGERDRLITKRTLANVTFETLQKDIQAAMASNATLSTEMEAMISEMDEAKDKQQQHVEALAKTFDLVVRYRRAFPDWDEDNVEQSLTQSTSTNIINRPAPTFSGKRPIQAPPLLTKGFNSLFKHSYQGNLLRPTAVQQGDIRPGSKGTLR